MKIVVLGGGISTERQASLAGANSVCKALRSLGHKAIFVDMFFGLEDYDGTLDEVFDVEGGFCSDVVIGRKEPDLDAIAATRKDNSNGLLGNRVLDVCKMADFVFILLHGKNGEDGRIQATFDLLGIPYTGSGYLASALGMDKKLTKLVMMNSGIPTPPEVKSAPCVVKVTDGGSSIGVWICKTDEEMNEAIKKTNDPYIVEKLIEGREFTVPVLDGKALDVIEIVAPNGEFDYVSKYQSGADGANEICPALITESEKELLQLLAVKIHNAMGLDVYSRSDFILDSDGNAWCLEVNTLPGMSGNSLIPKAALAAGMDYPHLCQKILDLSMELRKKSK